MSNGSRNASPLGTVEEKRMLNVKSGMSILDKTAQPAGRSTDLRGYGKQGCRVSYKLDMFRESKNSLGSNQSSIFNSKSPMRGKLSPHRVPYNALDSLHLKHNTLLPFLG